MGIQPISVCLFDLNETIVDMLPLGHWFGENFGNKALQLAWFENVLHSALVHSFSADYLKFEKLMKGALDALARETGQPLSKAERIRFFELVKDLPIHSDVIPALEYLQKRGIRIAALSNSSRKSAIAHLKKNNCFHYFEKVLSTDSVEACKPSPASYLYACRELKVAPSKVCLIAAHDWDIFGAVSSGLNAALVHRPGLLYSSSYPKVRFEAADMLSLVEKLPLKQALPKGIRKLSLGRPVSSLLQMNH